MKTLRIVLLILIIIGIGLLFTQKMWVPKLVDRIVASENTSALLNRSFTDSNLGVSFKYPENFGTRYVGIVDWPPKIQILKTPQGCTTEGSSIEMAGETEKKNIGGRDYCVTTLVEGAAGTAYYQYAYATVMKGQELILTFSLKKVQCENYDDPNKSECKAEQSAFNIDPIINQIVGTIKFN